MGVPDPARAELPRTWRIPPQQIAALILVATGLLAIDIYVRPAIGWLLFCAVVAAAALVGAVVAMRYLLAADEQGIWVRFVFHEYVVPWPDVATVEVAAGARNHTTVRITNVKGAVLDVPPSLLLPTLPTKMRRVHTLMASVARELLELAETQQREPRRQ